jgi:flagellar biosynthesis/type III secretory pathway protein FliH
MNGKVVEKGKLIQVVLVCLIIVGSMTGYYLGNNQGYQVGYVKGDESGYTRGYTEGDESGYLRGHDVGYKEGNATGYGVGYLLGTSTGYKNGYSAGNTIGYTSGLKVGTEQGYSQGYTKGNSTGYTNGYSIGYSKGMTTGTKWIDLTYQEMTTFLSNDVTNRLVYYDPTFICADFAATLSKNAYKLGYRCFSVELYFNYPSSSSSAHMINAFNTTDRGFVYVEPQSDRVMLVAIGQKYWERNGYQTPSYDDTITKIVIFP